MACRCAGKHLFGGRAVASELVAKVKDRRATSGINPEVAANIGVLLVGTSIDPAIKHGEFASFPLIHVTAREPNFDVARAEQNRIPVGNNLPVDSREQHGGFSKLPHYLEPSL